MLLLSMELFGVPLALSEFPRVKSLRGLGITDANYRPSLELNDLVDWHTLHAGLTARATA